MLVDIYSISTFSTRIIGLKELHHFGPKHLNLRQLCRSRLADFSETKGNLQFRMEKRSLIRPAVRLEMDKSKK